MNIEHFSPKTPKILIQALRQYQHNDCSGLLAGFDYDETIKIINSLYNDLKTANQALLEVHHAQVSGSQWYTRGERGLSLQVSMWVKRGLDATGKHFQDSEQRVK